MAQIAGRRRTRLSLLDADPTIHPAIRAALPEYNQIDFALSEHGSRILFNQDEVLPTTNIRRT